MARPASLIAGMREIGIVGVEHDVQLTHSLPIGTEVDTILILHTPSVGETGRQQRAVFLAVIALQRHEWQGIADGERQTVDCSKAVAIAIAIAGGCLAIERNAMVDIAIIDAGVPEVHTRRIVLTVNLLCIRLQFLVEMRVDHRCPGMEPVALPVEIASGCELMGVVFLVHFRPGAVIACLEDCPDVAGLVQRSVYGTVREERR